MSHYLSHYLSLQNVVGGILVTDMCQLQMSSYYYFSYTKYLRKIFKKFTPVTPSEKPTLTQFQ